MADTGSITKRKLTVQVIAPWLVLLVWSFVAILISWDDQVLEFSGTVGVVKALLLIVWIWFLAFSWRCTRRENFVKSIREIWAKAWGQQVIYDLYISVFLSLIPVYLVTGSILQTAFWAIAFIPFANQAILLFFILHVDEIAALVSAGA